LTLVDSGSSKWQPPFLAYSRFPKTSDGVRLAAGVIAVLMDLLHWPYVVESYLLNRFIWLGVSLILVGATEAFLRHRGNARRPMRLLTSRRGRNAELPPAPAWVVPYLILTLHTGQALLLALVDVSLLDALNPLNPRVPPNVRHKMATLTAGLWIGVVLVDGILLLATKAVRSRFERRVFGFTALAAAISGVANLVAGLMHPCDVCGPWGPGDIVYLCIAYMTELIIISIGIFWGRRTQRQFRFMQLARRLGPEARGALIGVAELPADVLPHELERVRRRRELAAAVVAVALAVGTLLMLRHGPHSELAEPLSVIITLVPQVMLFFLGAWSSKHHTVTEELAIDRNPVGMLAFFFVGNVVFQVVLAWTFSASIVIGFPAYPIPPEYAAAIARVAEADFAYLPLCAYFLLASRFAAHRLRRDKIPYLSLGLVMILVANLAVSHSLVALLHEPSARIEALSTALIDWTAVVVGATWGRVEQTLFAIGWAFSRNTRADQERLLALVSEEATDSARRPNRGRAQSTAVKSLWTRLIRFIRS
jgi:hypothetical protein